MLSEALACSEVSNHLLDLGVWCLGPGLRVVGVITLAVLLTLAAALVHEFADRGTGRCLGLPTNIEARQVAHGEWPHGEAEVEQHIVDLCRGGAFEAHNIGFDAAHGQHAVADETFTDADQGRDLADLLRDRHGGSNDLV